MRKVSFDLQKTVEDSVVHILHVALSSLDCAFTNEVLPADDWRKEHDDWDEPCHADHHQYLEHSHAVLFFLMNKNAFRSSSPYSASVGRHNTQ